MQKRTTKQGHPIVQDGHASPGALKPGPSTSGIMPCDYCSDVPPVDPEWRGGMHPRMLKDEKPARE